jgi:hypothetical protein
MSDLLINDNRKREREREREREILMKWNEIAGINE